MEYHRRWNVVESILLTVPTAVEFGDGSKVLDQSQSHPEVQARINLLFIASPWRYRWLRPSQSGNVFADPNRSQSELIHYLSLPGSSR